VAAAAEAARAAAEEARAAGAEEESRLRLALGCVGAAVASGDLPMAAMNIRAAMEPFARRTL
jgi:hypothetical protein